MNGDFHAHVELLRFFLAHRDETVETIQGLLNAQRKPIQYLQDGHLPLDEYIAEKELEERAKKNHRSPMQQFCFESRQAGNPEFYMSPIGPLPNPCRGGDEL